ncbi:hypothetical protein [Salininema proteolyticum]|uniref:Uncharacterized protein n=1 Tax=Salininema proteolyticum TaxID=1607685 RepID=A0ABV8TY93_9ACTN
MLWRKLLSIPRGILILSTILLAAAALAVAVLPVPQTSTLSAGGDFVDSPEPSPEESEDPPPDPNGEVRMAESGLTEDDIGYRTGVILENTDPDQAAIVSARVVYRDAEGEEVLSHNGEQFAADHVTIAPESRAVLPGLWSRDTFEEGRRVASLDVEFEEVTWDAVPSARTVDAAGGEYEVSECIRAGKLSAQCRIDVDGTTMAHSFAGSLVWRDDEGTMQGAAAIDVLSRTTVAAAPAHFYTDVETNAFAPQFLDAASWEFIPSVR